MTLPPEPGVPEVTGRGHTAGRVVMLTGALTTLMLVASTTQFGLGALGPHLQHAFSLTNSQLGMLTLAYFTMVALFSLVVPRALPRFRERTAVVALTALTMSGLAMMASATNVWWMLPGLCVASIATAAVNPVTNRAALPTGKSRETVIAIKQSGVALSTVACGVALPPLAAIVGWRNALLLYALVGILPVLLIRWAVFPVTPPQQVKATQSTVTYSIRQVTSYAFLMGAGSATISTYLALFVYADLNVDATAAGLVLACIGVGAILGRIVWGSLAIRASRRGDHLQKQLAAMGLIAAFASCGLAVSIHFGVILACLSAVALGLSASSWNPLAMMIAAASGEPFHTMRNSGRVMFGFFSGLALTPPAFGSLVDQVGYAAGWPATSVLFLLATAVVVRRPRAAQPSAQVPEPR